MVLRKKKTAEPIQEQDDSMEDDGFRNHRTPEASRRGDDDLASMTRSFQASRDSDAKMLQNSVSTTRDLKHINLR